MILQIEKTQEINKSEKFWDKIAIKFDNRSKHFEHPPVEKTKHYLKDGDIVLDYGCATGTVANEIADNVKRILGIDLSSKMIEFAKRKTGERKIDNIDFEQSTIFDERYKPESFDVILAFNILHLLENTPKVLQRINELLKPGGLIISATACMGEKTFLNILQVLLFSALIKLGMVPNMKFFKISELEDSITNGNFKIIEMRSLNSSSNFFIVAKKI